MRPHRPRGEPDVSPQFGVVVLQPRVVELIDLIESEHKTLSEVKIELHSTARFEKDRKELNPIAEIHLVIVRILDDAFASCAGHVKPIEQLVNCL